MEYFFIIKFLIAVLNNIINTIKSISFKYNFFFNHLIKTGIILYFNLINYFHLKKKNRHFNYQTKFMTALNYILIFLIQEYKSNFIDFNFL